MRQLIILILFVAFAGCSDVTNLRRAQNPLSALSLAHTSAHALSGISSSPNDPLYSQQTYLNAANVPQAWQVATGSSSQKMAVIAMGGINKNHEDLNARVTIKRAAASPFANNGAADPEAGIMGAATNNGKGIAGVNWSAPLLSYNIGKKVTKTVQKYPNGLQITQDFVFLDGSAVGPAINNAVNAGAKTILLPLNWVQGSHIPNITTPNFQFYPCCKATGLGIIFTDITKIAHSIIAATKGENHFASAIDAAVNAYKKWDYGCR